MKQIPDAAVQSVLDKWMPVGVPDSDMFEDMRAALTAAIPHLPLGFVVDRLVWSEYEQEGSTYRWDAEACGFHLFYDIQLQNDGYRVVFDHEAVGAIGLFGTIEEAKAAAQSDFERRVRECITLTNEGAKPVDVAAVRRLALEEATRVAEGSSGAFDHQSALAECRDCESGFHNGRVAAAAIRALSAEPAQPKGRYQALICKGVPSDCCDYGVVSHAEGKEVCRVWREDYARLIADLLNAEPAQSEQWQPTHRHVKRGTEYQLIGIGIFQAVNWKIHYETIGYKDADMQQVAIYRGEDGQLWARPILEFNDGRFEPLPAAPTSEAGR